MIDLISTAAKLQAILIDSNLPFCFIGGLALQYWGEPRLTLDIDVSVFVGFGNEDSAISILSERLAPRIQDAESFAKKNRVYLLQADNGIGIDVSLGAIPFEKEMAERAVEVSYTHDIRLRICGPEDLIVLKAFADRLQDWADIESVLLRGHDLNWPQIIDRLRPLVELKEEPEILTKLDELRYRTEA